MFSIVGASTTGVGSTTVGATAATVATATSATGVGSSTLTSVTGVSVATSGSFLSSLISILFFLFLLELAINIINAIKSNNTPPVINIPGIVKNQSKLNSIAGIYNHLLILIYMYHIKDLFQLQKKNNCDIFLQCKMCPIIYLFWFVNKC